MIVKNNLIPILVIFVIVCSLGMLGSITYFRGDDFIMLSLGQKYSNNVLEAFTAYIGGYRPFTWLMCALEYKLFGLNAFGYQFIISFIFSIAMFYLYKLGKILKGTVVGIISFLCFIFYYPSLSTLWWRANICYALYSAFYGMALVYGIKAMISGKNRYYFICLLASISALLTYEIAVTIIPSLIIYAFLYRHILFDKLKSCLFLLWLFLIFLSIFLISQYTQNENIIATRISLSLQQMLSHLDVWFRHSMNWFSFFIIVVATIGFLNKLWLKIFILFTGIGILKIFGDSAFFVYLPVIFCICSAFGSREGRFVVAITFIGILCVGTLGIPGQIIGMIRYSLWFWYGMSLFIGLGLGRLIEQIVLKRSKEHIKAEKMLQYVIIIPMLVLGVLQVFKNDYKLGRDELKLLRDKTNANKDAALYIKKTIPGEARVINLGEEFDYDYFLNHYLVNSKKYIDVKSGFESFYHNDNNITYIVGSSILLSKHFPQLANQEINLNDVFTVHFSKNIRGNVEIVEDDGIVKNKHDKRTFYYTNANENMGSITYLLDLNKQGVWITVIVYPRLMYLFNKDSYVKILCSNNNVEWKQVSYYGGKGLFNYWTPIFGQEIRKTFFVKSNRIYLKFQLQNGQLWSGGVMPAFILVNEERDSIYKDILKEKSIINTKETDKEGKSYNYLIKVKKNIAKELYGISILKIERL